MQSKGVDFEFTVLLLKWSHYFHCWCFASLFVSFNFSKMGVLLYGMSALPAHVYVYAPHMYLVFSSLELKFQMVVCHHVLRTEVGSSV